METILTVAVIITVLCNFGRLWWVSEGTLFPVYCLMIIGGISGTVLNITLFLNDPTQWAVLLINLTTMFMIAMGIKGLFRLRKEKRK